MTKRCAQTINMAAVGKKRCWSMRVVGACCTLVLWLPAALAAEPWPAPAVAAAGLPRFEHIGIVLDYANLKCNPCNDVIYPSVVRTDSRDKPLGKYYMYYAPHNAPGGICLAYADKLEGPWKEYEANPIIGRDWQPHYKVGHVSGPHAIWNDVERKLFVYYYGPWTDLHACEVDAAFEHPKYLGIFYPHDADDPENVAQMSECFIEENGKLFMFTNVGPRLGQKIALAVAPADTAW